MTTWLLEGFNTDRRYSDDVRYRAYTTSKRKAEAFNQIPKIQFTDSGHGIVFAATEVARGTRKLEPRYALDEYVREHLKAQQEALKPRSRKRATAAQLDALEEAFKAWAGDHGMIWFDNEAILAERLAVVLDIKIDWSEGNALALEASK